MNRTQGRPFGPDGCQVPVGKGICGETRTLDIINEFKRLYEEKIKEIDNAGGGDCMQEKIKLQQDWIGDLTEQNEMLVRAVEELEHEATERVNMLEDKLQQSAQCICEVMNRYREYDVTSAILKEPQQKIFNLENDLKNLMEFIRRIREDNEWSVGGLKFYEISYQDLFGKNGEADFFVTKNNISRSLIGDIIKEEKKVKDRECKIQELQMKIDDIEILTRELQSKKEECDTLQQKCFCLGSQKETLGSKLVNLEKEKHILEVNVKEEKIQIMDLEKQFKEFIKDRSQLKEKCKIFERKCKCIQEENEKLLVDNKNFRNETENLKEKVLKYTTDKRLLEIEMTKLKEDINNFINAEDNCIKKVESLSKENKKLMNELCQMNEENRNLLSTVDDQKKRICLMITVTQDEIGNLTRTIDELQGTLQKTKQLQEDEENKNVQKINTLKNMIEEFENKLKEAQEKTKVCKICRGRSRVGFADNTEVQTDLIDPEQLEQDIQLDLLEHRDNIIKSQNDTLNMMQQELQSLKETELDLRREKEEFCQNIECLKSKIYELEHVEADSNGDIKDNMNINKLMELVQNRDEIIRNQNETMVLMQQELESLKEGETSMKSEREKYNQNIQHLKNRINELEVTLQNSDGRADNLQMAVDLYMNSINVLEASQTKYEIEIDQQRATISNLQKALVDTKQELDTTKQKCEENEVDKQKVMSGYTSIMADMELEKNILDKRFNYILEEYERLQELNLNVEIEHCNSLQDVDGLDNNLFKYQHLLKAAEEENRTFRSSFNKVKKQKKCYEEVIIYFKHEMGLMSEQLQNLQELLTLSNNSAHEESSKLMQAFMNVQSLNQQLSTQLNAAEQTVLLENQMNQLHEAKISELERLVSEKEIDLGRHDQAIANIRHTLQCSLKQNEDLHATIVSLNETIMKLQNAIRNYEIDNGKSREIAENCQAQINSCKEKLIGLKEALEKKTAELCKLEMAYNNQNRTLKSAQMELNEMKEKEKNKQCHLKCIIEDMKDKLAKSEEKYRHAREELHQLKTQLGIVTRKDTVKEVEIKRYRKIIGDLKKTLMDLNKNLSKRNIQFESKCNNDDCRKYMEQTGEETDQDICLNCPCEVEFYQSIVETLKKSVIELKKKLTETQKRNQQLEEESKRTQLHLAQISKSQMERDREYNDLKQKLMQKLKQAEMEESRYLEQASQFQRELGSLRQQLELKTLQLDECKKSAQETNSSRCVQLACAQEEVSTLKEDLNKLLRKHCALNVENERLHSQSLRMQSTVSGLEESSQLLKGQVEQYLSELQMVQNEKDALMRKNHDLLTELRSLQSSYSSANKQQRYNQDSIQMLQTELNEVKNSRDEICFESKNVIDYFRSWLQEQNKINQYVMSKEREYCNTIDMLKREAEDLRYQCVPPVQRQCPRVIRCPKFAPPTCQSPWSLGSQGTASVHDDSPSRSPYPNECDWYSSTFRNESEEEEEEEEEDWVSKVEDLAAQVRRTNKMWKNKMGNSEYTVSKDAKK
ncbi:uncharacterized protein isoform X4 [Leptinotarsa decemlineata]|uniref:uncharacterized protein isoform X4 n=1 Tax=Leptinotarsa decemlineata TaxID=7539 RepID=UPI003D3087FE